MGAFRIIGTLSGLALGSGAAGCAPPKPELPPPASSTAEGEEVPVETETDDGGSEDTGEPAPPVDADGGSGEDGDAPTACQEALALGSHEGCELWAVDLPKDADAPVFAVSVVNSSPSTAAVRVFGGAETTPVAAAEIASGEAHTFELPAMNASLATTSDVGIAYRIESDVPVAAYQFNPVGAPAASSDASRLLPTHLLGSHYSAVTGNGLWSADELGFLGAFISVVAVEDGTVIDVFPTWHNIGGAAREGVRLDRGEVFTAISQSDNPFPQLPLPQAELSGSRIVASKPVAVFSGNVATQEPIETCCADHLEEQLLPVDAWGTQYAVAPPPARSGEGHDPAAYRIVGAVDGTELVYSPEAPTGAPTSIDAEETVRFETDQPFTVTSADPTKAFSITQFLLSHQAVDGAMQRGDPAMLVLPAREHFGTTHVVFAPDGFTESFATIVRGAGAGVAADDVHGMVDAAWLPLGAIDGIDYELTSVPIAEGPHVVECETPCAVLVVGHGEASSYGYVAGLAAR